MAISALAAVATAPVQAERLDGPVLADVIEVVDGDTLRVSARIWPGQTVRVLVRLRGIDAPERRARCEAERQAAHRARSALAALVAGGPVELRAIGGGKYYGRVLADIRLADGGDPARHLLEARLVRPYGKNRRERWCLDD
ncbi:MAG: thermonuclease family protein [Rhizobiaceae bacterium]|nr:thermonuclease family protein [Rhizobiaceae bacterium]MCV0407261.1 thermonuclease family protein [Rhizobiaceae bacterium]